MAATFNRTQVRHVRLQRPLGPRRPRRAVSRHARERRRRRLARFGRALERHHPAHQPLDLARRARGNSLRRQRRALSRLHRRPRFALLFPRLLWLLLWRELLVLLEARHFGPRLTRRGVGLGCDPNDCVHALL